MQHKELEPLEQSPYAELYRNYAPGLFSYAYQQTLSREDAEDIVLDVFLSVLQNARFPAFETIVATFGRVNKPLFIPTLTWSPDSTMLASTTNHAASVGQPELLQNTVQVWKLS